jgi:hypothetical protein
LEHSLRLWAAALINPASASTLSYKRISGLIDIHKGTPLEFTKRHALVFDKIVLSDVDFYLRISFVSIALIALAIRMTIREMHFISGIDHRQASQSG